MFVMAVGFPQHWVVATLLHKVKKVVYLVEHVVEPFVQLSTGNFSKERLTNQLQWHRFAFGSDRNDVAGDLVEHCVRHRLPCPDDVELVTGWLRASALSVCPTIPTELLGHGPVCPGSVTEDRRSLGVDNVGTAVGFDFFAVDSTGVDDVETSDGLVGVNCERHFNVGSTVGEDRDG